MSRTLSRVFSDRVVIGAVLVDTVAQFIMASTRPDLVSAALRDPMSTVYLGAHVVDYACIGYFVLEAVAKIRVDGFRAYWNNGWNRFDFIVVLLSLPALLGPLFPLRHMSTFVVLRIGRVFRLFRLLRFIPHADHLYAGIKRALKASVGVLIALLLINLVLALGATQLFGRSAPQYFGNPALSMYSMFRVFTVEGWHEIPDLLVLRGGSNLWAFFVRGYWKPDREPTA